MFHRLYVFTGKGGVGKTTLALSYALYLKSLGKKVAYNAFDNPAPAKVCNQLGLDYFDLDVDDSAVEYMGQKLKSTTVASWIMKTPFFHSLFNMTPSLALLILLGHIINKLEKDPELHIVLDSPASGHAISMFEASHNFKDMFKSGLLVSDIKRMHDVLYQEGFLKIIIPTLPTIMSLQESIELTGQLQRMDLSNIDLLLNDSLKENEEIKNADEDLPEFLEKKLQMEDDLLVQHTDDINLILPHISSNDPVQLIEELSLKMEGVK